MSQSSFGYFRKSLVYILSRFVFNRKHLTAHSDKYDLQLRFRIEDGGGRAIYKKGLYEEELTHFLINKLKLNAGEIVFDIGANIGWYSNLLSKKFPKIEVHSFEPDPENFEILIHNLQLNGANSVKANKMGISEKTEIKQLHLYKKSNIGRHSMLDINDGPTIDVETISLDDYVIKHDLNQEQIKFLKIDIEGFEDFAFLGGTQLLKSLPIILAEFSPGYMRKGGVEPADLLKLLRSYDYSPFVIKNLELQPIDDKTLLERNVNINLLWVKKGNPLLVAVD